MPADKQKLYRNALNDLQQGNCDHKAQTITSFVKMEYLTTTKFKATRMIQGRDPRFNILLGRYIKQLEHTIYSRQTRGGRLPNFAKGFTLSELGEQVRRIISKFKRPKFILLDHTEFDAHITSDHLKGETGFIKSCFRGADRREVERLLKKTYNNRCHTRNGLSYRVKATRMSGDVTTGFNNSLTNFCILTEMFKGYKHHILVNGDDSIVFVEEDTPVPDLACFKVYNMETKIDNVTTIPEEIEFCQNRFVYLDNGEGYMMPNLNRIQSRFGRTFKLHSFSPKHWVEDYHQYCSEVAWCLASLYQPIKELHSYWTSISESFRTGRRIKVEHFERSLKIKADINRRQPLRVSSINQSIMTAYPDIVSQLNRHPRMFSNPKVQQTDHFTNFTERTMISRFSGCTMAEHTM